MIQNEKLYKIIALGKCDRLHKKTFLVLQQQQNLAPPPPVAWTAVRSKMVGGSVVDSLFIVTPIVGVCNCSVLLYVTLCPF